MGFTHLPGQYHHSIPFSAFSDYVNFSYRVEMPALVVGLSS